MAVFVPVSVHAGGSAENAVLIVDPTKPQSLQVANHYRRVRDLPAANVVHLDPNPGTYAEFAALTSDAVLGALENQGLLDHADYLVIAPGTSFYLSAPGLVSDDCFPVNRFSTTAPYALLHHEQAILAGNQGAALPNGYYRGNDDAIAFDAGTGWSAGSPSASGPRYFLAAMLGYDGPLGNTIPEILAMIDRSAAADGTRPAGTVYYMQTNDLARSGPRHGAYPAATASILALGGLAQHLFADLPLGHHDCLGIMTGLADPDVTNADLSILPGAFCDHLTSYAATFDSPSQTKMSRWISKGASGTSGAVEEPCNYPAKFPHARLHVFYEKGLSLGEAWFRSLGAAPFQTLLTGDPLTRPHAYLPSVALAGVPAGAASGQIELFPSATTAHPTAQIAGFELLIDGRSHSKKTPGEGFVVDTTALADGWHELRVLAWDGTPVRSTGRWIGALVVDNHGRSVTLAAPSASGDLSTRFDLQASASGGAVLELRLVEGSRVVGAAQGSPATIPVFGRTLGAGHVPLALEAQFADGRTARSAPVELVIADAGTAPTAVAPIAFSYAKRVRTGVAAIVELPAASDATLGSVSWTLLSSPAQATVLPSATGPWRVVRPNAGAAGSDTLTFRCDSPAGASNVATVTLVYEAPEVCAPSSYCVAAPNSAGPGAHLVSYGSTSIGANDFVLYASGLPADRTGIFLYSRSSAQVPLGDGVRCVGSPIWRIGVVQSDFFGDVIEPLDWTEAPFVSGAGAATTGTTGYFQLWYRDPGFGPAGTNLTDGLRVPFCF